MISRSGLRIGFMGTPDFALVALKALVEAGENIVCVYSQPPRPKGRGHRVQKSPVHDYAERQGIPVFIPESLKDPIAQAEFDSHDLDVCIVAAYGLILPEPILKAPKYGCLNIHGSLLPRWRGAAPIQYAIWKGDAETGVTIMQMEKGLDTGPMILKKSIPITAETTASQLHDELAEIGADLSLQALKLLAKNGHIEAKAQDDRASTYASMLKKSDGIIDWTQSAEQISAQVRALNPWPGVWTRAKGKRLKILAVRVSPCDGNAPEAQAGALIDKSGLLACGSGKEILKLDLIQPEGKKPMDVAAAINGGYIEAGDVLGAENEVGK